MYYFGSTEPKLHDQYLFFTPVDPARAVNVLRGINFGLSIFPISISKKYLDFQNFGPSMALVIINAIPNSRIERQY